MDMIGIIENKKQGRALSESEIAFFIKGASSGQIPDYQLAALLMAIRLNGMTEEETAILTLAMAHSGDMADLGGIPGRTVDKHSTGGVGDTTTLVLAPLVAACGVPVAKMSGRGLGHTGGTLDKLESIPGFRVELTQVEFIEQVKRIGCAVIGQSKNMVPADKALYALRDVTATVDSLPLIASSIMSKKLASGAGAIVLDVKTGSGAIMRSLQGSIDLAKAMVDIGFKTGRPTVAIVTGMAEPLGSHVGNALEVKEAIDILAGRTKGPLLHVSLVLGSHMLMAAGRASSLAEAEKLLDHALVSGAGLKKLREMVTAQGGDGRVCDDVSLLPKAPVLRPVLSKEPGFVQSMDTAQLGLSAQRMGAGRVRKGDAIDPAVGFVLHKRIGDRIEKGETLVTIHARDEKSFETAQETLLGNIIIGPGPVSPEPLIHAVVTKDGVQNAS
jgi:pyrimidine-nucleoside phosphorylase